MWKNNAETGKIIRGNNKHRNKDFFIIIILSSFKSESLNILLGVDKENTSEFQGNPNLSSEISHRRHSSARSGVTCNYFKTDSIEYKTTTFPYF